MNSEHKPVKVKTIWNARKKKMKKLANRTAASLGTIAASHSSRGHVQEAKLSWDVAADETSADVRNETVLI